MIAKLYCGIRQPRISTNRNRFFWDLLYRRNVKVYANHHRAWSPQISEDSDSSEEPGVLPVVEVPADPGPSSNPAPPEDRPRVDFPSPGTTVPQN